MTCPSCGNENAAGGVFCMRCGAPLQQTAGDAPAASAPVVSERAAQPASGTAAPPIYGGFWRRFFAMIIDAVILFVVSLIIFIPIGMVVGLAGVAGGADNVEGTIAALEGPLQALNFVVSITLQWLYEAVLTSSSKQGTLGKMALGLVVTDLEGNRISFARASARHFAKYVSTFALLIGYLIQPFTKKRQALHDILAGTLVW